MINFIENWLSEIAWLFLHVFFAFIFANGKYWGEFTAFGDMIVMFSFIIIQFIVLRKYFKTSE